ncbi:putative signal peptide protein [Acinetobacter baumannii 1440422]|nr:hypothetical protein C6W84_1695 [Acinetobacter baumannii]EXB41180.1 putative signal peptide protein [Acinetobacter baumannii 1440422]
MGANAPSQIIVPQAYTAKTLKLENESIEIKGKKELTYLWVPSAKAVVGGFRYLQVFIYGWQIHLKPKIVWKSFNL